jgi:putative transposase
MPRRPRCELVIPGVPHHIVNRGNNRRRLFSYPPDYRRFLDLMRFAFEREHSPLHQLSLMPNHFHLIATPDDEDSLSKAMQSCQQRYAQARNRRKHASGRLFEERFWCEPLVTMDDVEKITLYNDANAMGAAMVEHPADHVWSTCAIHYGQPARSAIPLEMWTPSGWYLSLGPDAPEIYAERMKQFLEGRVQHWRFDRLREIEQLASLGYGTRMARPDGRSAR